MFFVPNREPMIFYEYEVSTDQKCRIIHFFSYFFPVEFGSGLFFLRMFAHLWEPGRAAILATSSGVRENRSATRGSAKQSTRAVYWTVQNRNVYFLPTNWSWTLIPDQRSQKRLNLIWRPTTISSSKTKEISNCDLKLFLDIKEFFIHLLILDFFLLLT